MRSLIPFAAVPLTVLAALSGALPPATPADATEWDIYLVGGQSNAAGWNTRARGLPESLKAQIDVKFFNGPDGTWDTLTPGSGNKPTSFGPEITLGRTLADENPTRSIAIVKYAVGGTNLAQEWNPRSAEPNLYDHFTTTITTATAALPDNDAFRIRGMIWMQGESDAGKPEMTAAYEANLTALIKRVREDVGVADLPFSIGQLGAVPGRDGMGEVQNAQAAVAARDPNVSLVITSDLALQKDNLHFTNASQQELGVRFAAGLQGQLNDIQVANPSFEFTHVPDDGGVNSRNVSAWEESSLKTTGNFNPDGSYYADPAAADTHGGSVGAMEGTNALFFANKSGDQYVIQTLSSPAEVGVAYTLTVAVGDRDAGSRKRFAGYRVQLLSDGKVLATESSSRTPGNGTFTDVTLTYTVKKGDRLGPLAIRLGTRGVGRNAKGRATDFDHVRLTATPAP